METAGGLPSHVLPVPRWTIVIHAVQILFAVIILGLDAYGIHWIAYNALIFSLVAAILTFMICIYVIGTSLFLHNLYNMYIVLALHLLMVIFWIVDMGLVANLARIWADPLCSYSYYFESYSCYYRKRDLALSKRDEIFNFKTYYGTLAAGAFFGAVEFATWVLSAIIVVIYLNKHRSSHGASSHAPPAYVGHTEQSVPLEQKYGQTAQPQQQPVYGAPTTPQPQYPQPVQQSPGQFAQQPVYGQQQQYTAPYPQDPVNRAQTVSPVSQAGYKSPAQNASELASPQHTGTYNPNASELSSQK